MTAKKEFIERIAQQIASLKLGKMSSDEFIGGVGGIIFGVAICLNRENDKMKAAIEQLIQVDDAKSAEEVLALIASAADILFDEAKSVDISTTNFMNKSKSKLN